MPAKINNGLSKSIGKDCYLKGVCLEPPLTQLNAIKSRFVPFVNFQPQILNSIVFISFFLPAQFKSQLNLSRLHFLTNKFLIGSINSDAL